CRNKQKEHIAIRAKIIILGGGTVGTAKLLINSREFLPFLSHHVGKNIACNGSIKVAGILPEGFIEGDMLSGRSHPGMISYQFLESWGITISAAKPLPLQLVTAAHLVLDGETRQPAHWGEANVELMKLYRRRMIVLYALGLTPPTAEIRRVNQNSFQPALDIDGELRRYHKRTKKLLHAILAKNGCKVIHDHSIDHKGKEYEDLHFATTHMVGSCRMADRKGDGVVDAHGEVFDYPGLYVTDGAAIPTSLAVNSSLTILANAERIAAHLTQKFSRSRI
ncbi:MAG: GMC family oxidoreductase, partial [bacterium]